MIPSLEKLLCFCCLLALRSFSPNNGDIGILFKVYGHHIFIYENVSVAINVNLVEKIVCRNFFSNKHWSL